MAKTDNLTDFLVDVADAIREKKGTTDPINPQNFSDEIRAFEIGGGGSASKWTGHADVIFFDYDGEEVYRYNKEDFLALSELPSLPTHEGLIGQAWNWELEAAKQYVSENGKLIVGANYTTDDGTTRFYVYVKSSYTITLHFQLNGDTKNVTIDWGDNKTSAATSAINKITHTYERFGYYCIRVSVAEGCEFVLGPSDYSSSNGLFLNCPSAVYKAEIGERTSIYLRSFMNCYALSIISLPSNLQGAIGSGTFGNTRSLKALVVPKTITILGSDSLSNNYALKILSLSQDMTKTYGVYGCPSLLYLVIPPNAIYGTFEPSGSPLKWLVSPSTANRTETQKISNNRNLEVAVLKDNNTTLSSELFSGCYSLKVVELGDNIQTIDTKVFYQCYSLEKIVASPNLTAINSYAFYQNTALKYIDFSQCSQIPSLASTSAFSELPSNANFIIPDALYEEWINATNWSAFPSKFVKASEFNG